MTTYTGRRVYPLDMRDEDIVIEDIAHALAHQCRFAGHVRTFWSVAQHSVLVSQHCDREDAFWGLLHDASEAYLCDLPRPLKHSASLAGYRDLEASVQARVCRRFGLPLAQPASVTGADRLVCYAEMRELMRLPDDYQVPESRVLIPARWKPREAEARFLMVFGRLMREGVGAKV